MDTGATLTAALLDVCRALNGANVPYCLAGGLVVSMLTTKRATADIDVVVSDNMATKTHRKKCVGSQYVGAAREWEPPPCGESARCTIICFVAKKINYIVNCAAAACCALTSNTIIAVASSCLGWRLLVPPCGVDAFVANSSASALIPAAGGIHAVLKTVN